MSKRNKATEEVLRGLNLLFSRYPNLKLWIGYDKTLCAKPYGEETHPLTQAELDSLKAWGWKKGENAWRTYVNDD